MEGGMIGENNCIFPVIGMLVAVLLIVLINKVTR